MVYKKLNEKIFLKVQVKYKFLEKLYFCFIKVFYIAKNEESIAKNDEFYENFTDKINLLARKIIFC